MKDISMEEKPYPVFGNNGTTQDGETFDRWSWVEPSVWTKRMLTTLEQGVKGGHWYSLFDKVWRPSTLYRAFERVKANRGSPGIDHQTIKMFERDLDRNITRLSDQLREDRYQPQPVQRRWIDKAGSKSKRPLGIPTVRDRVVQTALRMVLEPIFEADFSLNSYGFRPKRGCKDALREVQRLLDAGYTCVLDADLKSYFDTIDQSVLISEVRGKVTDGNVIRLLRMYLSQSVMDGLTSWIPERGTPQGAVISPLLANIYLDPLDQMMAGDGYAMIRYADDFVVLCRSEEEAAHALSLITAWTASVGLTLHPTKTHIVDATKRGGFDFLGYHFERGLRWPSKKSQSKFKDTIRAKTRRSYGHSLSFVINDLNRTIKGWFEYFKHSRPWIFRLLDGWIRMRLRSILRKRRGGRGRGRGVDHVRWKNSFFVKHGLFSMVTAHALACQSALR